MLLWSFGEEVYGILEKYLRLRERMRPQRPGVDDGRASARLSDYSAALL